MSGDIICRSHKMAIEETSVAAKGSTLICAAGYTKTASVCEGNRGVFWHAPHAKLTPQLDFELLHNYALQVVGKLWSRVSHIPMGGPFSAQCADLDTMWGIKRAGAKLGD